MGEIYQLVKKREVSLSKENTKCKGTKVGKNMEFGKRAKKIKHSIW